MSELLPGAELLGHYSMRTLRFEPLPKQRGKCMPTPDVTADTVRIRGLNSDQRGAIRNMVPPEWIVIGTATIVTFHRQPPGTDGDIVAELERLIGARKSLDGTINKGRGFPIQPLQAVLRKMKEALA